MRTDAPTDRRWSRIEYERLIALEVLHEDEPVELIGGHLVVREPQASSHAVAIELATDALRRALGRGFRIRVQLPIALDDDSEPEPDLAVIAGQPRDSVHPHPAHPALVVEIADSRLDFDRHHKGGLYARAGLADYWVVNLVERVLEVRREPARDASAPFGWRYRSVTVLGPGAVAAPLVAPSSVIVVDDLLP